MKHLNCVIIAVLMVGLLAAAAQAKGFFKVGDPAPNFTLETLDGQTVSLAQYKGKVVVLGLFHICEPCLIQGTELQKVHEAFQGKKDRKSTRLNSSHSSISYAVFCLKKKTSIRWTDKT